MIKIKYWINSYNIAVCYFEEKYFNLLEEFSLLLGIKNFFEIKKMEFNSLVTCSQVNIEWA